MTWALVGYLGCALATSSAAAQAPPPIAAETGNVTAACVSAFDQAQTLRGEGKLLAARKQLQICSEASCPDVVTSKCMPWLEDVNASLPSIVIVAKDEAGRDVIHVRVMLGEEILTEQLDGRPLELDPGVHILRFERADAPPVEQQIVAREGEKHRAVEVRFAGPEPSEPAPVAAPRPPAELDPATEQPPATTPDSSDSPGLSPLFYVGVGIAGAGLLVGSLTGLTALGNGSELDEKCQIDCSQDEIDEAFTVAHISTVGFAFAGAGVLLGVIGLLSSPDEESTGSGSLQPLLGPGLLGLSGRF